MQQHNGSIGFGFMNADMSRVMDSVAANSMRRQSVDMPVAVPSSSVKT